MAHSVTLRSTAVAVDDALKSQLSTILCTRSELASLAHSFTRACVTFKGGQERAKGGRMLHPPKN